MVMIMNLRLMRRMHMLMAAMLFGMLMGMHMGIFCMSMLVGMLVQMLMRVRVRMLMQVDHILMLVLMAVSFPVGMSGSMLVMLMTMFVLMAVVMGMLMRMQVFMFVLTFHGVLLFTASLQVRPKIHGKTLSSPSSLLDLQRVSPNAMAITISQGVKRFEFLDLVNLETNIGVDINWRTRSPAKIDHLVILLHPIEFDPGDVMFRGIGMRNFVANDDPNNVLAFLVSLINGDTWHMFFFTLILVSFDDSAEIHVILRFA
jgi:hypothetical protein